jgi:hypothetical protein
MIFEEGNREKRTAASSILCTLVLTRQQASAYETKTGTRFASEDFRCRQVLSHQIIYCFQNAIYFTLRMHQFCTFRILCIRVDCSVS